MWDTVVVGLYIVGGLFIIADVGYLLIKALKR